MDNKVISTLNGLIAICKDGQEGFKTAAEGLRAPNIRSLFLEYSTQRARFASELQDEVRRLGGNPEQSGSASGAMHRGWINIKSLATGKDEAAIISEAERGEDAAKKAYEEALDSGLTANVEAIVRRQFADVKQAHDRVRALELTAKQ
jgi:uncharacterized protein (TIGR02284 family)